MAINKGTGSMQTGGQVTIRFPNMEMNMSMDNETEMKAVMDMMEAMLKIHETEKAKAALMLSISKDKDVDLDIFKQQNVRDSIKLRVATPYTMSGLLDTLSVKY